MEKNIIQLTIKCDNPNCDYMNDSVNFNNLEDFLNKSCPKCGENLLTEKNLNLSKILIFVLNELEEMLAELKKNIEEDNTPYFEDNSIFNISEEELIELEEILKRPNGKEIIKKLMINFLNFER